MIKYWKNYNEVKSGYDNNKIKILLWKNQDIIMMR